MGNYYFELIINHYSEIWKNIPKFYLWDKGPIEKLPADFRVLEFPPNDSRNIWTYATCGMSQIDDEVPIELHIFSIRQDSGIIELLTSIVYYHRNTSLLDLHHTVNFGKPWQNESFCEYGFISLPFLDGPDLETLYLEKFKKVIKFYWLIPVTVEEVKYKINFGVEALEEKFDEGLDYVNPRRKSLI